MRARVEFWEMFCGGFFDVGYFSQDKLWRERDREWYVKATIKIIQWVSLPYATAMLFFTAFVYGGNLVCMDVYCMDVTGSRLCYYKESKQTRLVHEQLKDELLLKSSEILSNPISISLANPQRPI